MKLLSPETERQSRLQGRHKLQRQIIVNYLYNMLNFIIVIQKKPELSKNLSFKSNGVECGKEPLKYFERPLLHL